MRWFSRNYDAFRRFGGVVQRFMLNPVRVIHLTAVGATNLHQSAMSNRTVSTLPST